MKRGKPKKRKIDKWSVKLVTDDIYFVDAASYKRSPAPMDRQEAEMLLSKLNVIYDSNFKIVKV